MLQVNQRQLNLRTYYYLYTGEIDGIEGKSTIEAYKKFQEKEGLVIDGLYGENTNIKLIEVIKDIQNKLNQKGYDLVIDGIVGNATISAITDFQRINNLSEDGIVGEKTMEKLISNEIDNTDDWRNIEHFEKSEFACKDNCGFNNIDINLVNVLENIRTHFNSPVIVTSGCRCEKHNRLVGGVNNSKHLLGKACDFVVKNVPTYQVLNYCYKLKNEGIIRYCYGETNNMGNAVHIDIN